VRDIMLQTEILGEHRAEERGRVMGPGVLYMVRKKGSVEVMVGSGGRTRGDEGRRFGGRLLRGSSAETVQC